MTHPSPEADTLSVRGPVELITAVPYLLGFVPERSLVLVAMQDTALIVTVRIDLADCDTDALEQSMAAIGRAGATGVAAIAYTDLPLTHAHRDDVCCRVREVIEAANVLVIDVLLVTGDRWWSLLCTDTSCCPPEGRELPTGTSVFAATAVSRGLVALPSRSDLATALDQLPTDQRIHAAVIAGAESRALALVLDRGPNATHRAQVRRLFAATRQSDLPGDELAADLLVSLGSYAVRDAVWLAGDNGRVDGSELFRNLAARAPDSRRAPPPFLFAWSSWRQGNGALASIAAELALTADPSYSAADLLLAALSRGVDPRTLPKLRTDAAPKGGAARTTD